MACASFSSHLSLVRSMSYSRANQSSVKRLVVTSLVSHVTTRLIVVSSTINALICISSPPLLTCSCARAFLLLRIVVWKAACLPSLPEAQEWESELSGVCGASLRRQFAPRRTALDKREPLGALSLMKKHVCRSTTIACTKQRRVKGGNLLWAFRLAVRLV